MLQKIFSTCLSCLFVSITSSIYAQQAEWLSFIEGSLSASVNSMCKDGDDNYYVTGRISNGSVNGEPFWVDGGYDAFLAKFNMNGDLQWIVTPGGSDPFDPFDPNENDFGLKVVYDTLTNAIYLSGSYQGTYIGGPAVFGPGIEIYGTGAFLAKYNTEGVCQWMQSTNNGHITQISLDGLGNIYTVCESSAPTTDYHGPPVLTISAERSIAKFTGSGQLLWVKSLGESVAGGIHVQGDRIYFGGGIFAGAGVLIDLPVENDHGTSMAIIAATDTAFSEVLWLEQFSSTVFSSVTQLEPAHDQTFLFAGAFKDSLFIAGDTVVGSPIDHQRYYGKIDTAGNVVWQRSILAVSSGSVLAVAGDSTFYLSSKFSGSFDLDGAIITAANPRDLMVVRCAQDGSPLAFTQFGPVDPGGFDMTSSSDMGFVVTSGFTGRLDVGPEAVTGWGDLFVAKFGPLVTNIATYKTSTTGSLLIYANPNDGTCTIELPQELQWTNDLVLKIHDSQGRLVQSMPLRKEQGTVTLDIRAQAKGIYPVEVTDGRQRYSGTIVFQ